MKQTILLKFVMLVFLLAFHKLEASQILVIDVSNMTVEEGLAVSSFQGLANRDIPQVYLRAKGTNMWGRAWKNWDNNVETGAIDNAIFDQFPNSEDVYMDYYTKTFGFTFKDVTFEEALKALPNVYKGVVKYTSTSLSSPAGVSVALTAAGMEDAIPVTTAVLNKFPNLKILPIVRNFHLQFTDKYKAYNYLLTQYKDRVSKRFLHSYTDQLSADLAVKMKMFTSDLTFASPRSVRVASQYKADTLETNLLNKICTTINYQPSSTIWGWAGPDEGILIFRAGELGMSVLCSQQPNASFHAAVKVSETEFKQKRKLDETNVTLANKVYIAFQSNEGDTYKCLGGLMNEGTWLQRRKGQIKMNWGVNPLVFKLMPALAKYYYDSQTTNDYFFNATAGVGYVNAGEMNTIQRDSFAMQVKYMSKYADTHHIDIWWYRASDWVAKMGLVGQQSWEKLSTGVTYPKVAGQLPIINYEVSYQLTSENYRKRPENLAKYLGDKANNPKIVGKPWFEIVYAIDPDMAYKTMEILNNQYPGRFEAVCMDEMFKLADQAKNVINGISIPRNETLYNSLIADNTNYFTFINSQFDLPSGFRDGNVPTRNVDVSQKDGFLVLTKNNSGTHWGITARSFNYDFDKYPYIQVKLDTTFMKFNVQFAEITLPFNLAYRDPKDRQIFTWDVKKIIGKSGFVSGASFQFKFNNAKTGDVIKIDYIKSLKADTSYGSVTSNMSYPALGGTQNTTIASNLIYQVGIKDSWVSLQSIAGLSNSVLGISVQTNPDGNSRNSVLTVFGVGINSIINVSQAAAELAVSTNQIILPNTMTSTLVTVTSNINWSAQTDNNFINLSTTTASGNGTLIISVLPNENTLSGKNFTVSLLGGNLIQIINISQEVYVPDKITYMNYPALGGIQNITIASDLIYKVGITDNWLSLQSITGLGNSVMGISVQTNPDENSRNSTLTIFGIGFNSIINITQAAAELAASTNQITLPSTMTSTIVTITSNINWTAQTDSDFINLSTTTASGNGTLIISALSNENTVSGKNFTVSLLGGNLIQIINISQEVYVPDKIKSLEFNIYPNPSQGSFTVTSNIAINYQMYSLEGRLLQTGSLIEGLNDIETKLGSGFYLIRAGNATKKLLLE
jgi:hypothetical protein